MPDPDCCYCLCVTYLFAAVAARADVIGIIRVRDGRAKPHADYTAKERCPHLVVIVIKIHVVIDVNVAINVKFFI